jgi:hypothetical protein
LATHADEVEGFWTRFAPPPSPASAAETGFLRDEWGELARTVWGGLWGAAERDDPAATVRAVRQALERCKNDIRAILAGDGGASSSEVV